MQVRRLIFREMGTYNDMPVRPFDPSFKPKHADYLRELTLDGQDLSPETLSSLSGEIMRPSSRAEGIAPIVHGWGEKRLMFIMEVVIRATPTSETLEIITGYTDYLGLSSIDSRKVKIDPDLRMYFSGRFEVRSLQSLGRHGNELVTNIHDAAQVLSRRSRPDLSQPNGHNGTVSLRPEDLFVHKTIPQTSHKLSMNEGYRDMRAGFGRTPLKLSSRYNTQSAQYLSKTLKAYRNTEPSEFLSSPSEMDPENARMTAARGTVKELSLTAKGSFEMMSHDSNILSSGYITYGELTAMNPDIDDIADVYTALKGEPVHRRGDTANWGDRDNETIAATIVSNSVPTFLMDCMYSGIRFIATNNTLGGVITVKVARLIPFMSDADIDSNFNALLHRIETQLIPDVTLNGKLVINLEVECSINGDTRIWISIDGDEEREFVFPTFCEAVASPMLSENPDSISLLSRDIAAIADELTFTTSDNDLPIIDTPIRRSPLRGKTL